MEIVCISKAIHRGRCLLSTRVTVGLPSFLPTLWRLPNHVSQLFFKRRGNRRYRRLDLHIAVFMGPWGQGHLSFALSSINLCFLGAKAQLTYLNPPSFVCPFSRYFFLYYSSSVSQASSGTNFFVSFKETDLIFFSIFSFSLFLFFSIQVTLRGGRVLDSKQIRFWLAGYPELVFSDCYMNHSFCIADHGISFLSAMLCDEEKEVTMKRSWRSNCGKGSSILIYYTIWRKIYPNFVALAGVSWFCCCGWLSWRWTGTCESSPIPRPFVRRESLFAPFTSLVP
ncbi:uncharacterized protein LOC111299687 [Durio zibethinus]|uniref:Uncharacterized protein LOC111299687 n=1 Tax=Durio zibethinus TaxID=66656 RepID=A0A6P5ZE42_DURZI|nr:uncharacterized protein LOC111299687 [Durio zibethinus]